MGTDPNPYLCILMAGITGLGVICHGGSAAAAHGPSRPMPMPGGPVAPMLLLDAEQAEQAVQDAATLLELDQFFNAIHSKGKRGQQGPADKGLTRDLITQVLQPGGAGMWFGPRLGRRRRSVPESNKRRERRSAQDEDVEDHPWKQAMLDGRLAELIKELHVRDSLAPKRSHCDPSEFNCILYNIAASRPIAASSEPYQHSRSEGNLVNFTPRLGRESGEDMSSFGQGEFEGRSRRLHMEDDNPLWFSPRLGRRSVSSAEAAAAAATGAQSGSGSGSAPAEGEGEGESDVLRRAASSSKQ